MLLLTSFIVIENIGIDYGETVAYIIWIVFTIVTFYFSKRFLPIGFWQYGSKGNNSDGKWLPVKKAREKVVNTPRFMGRVDRQMGIVEATARGVEKDKFQKLNKFLMRDIAYNVIRLRAEVLHSEGNTEYISVEIVGKSSKWAGNIMDGDRFRVKGKFKHDGILRSNYAFNYSMNSYVGVRGFFSSGI